MEESKKNVCTVKYIKDLNGADYYYFLNMSPAVFQEARTAHPESHFEVFETTEFDGDTSSIITVGELILMTKNPEELSQRGLSYLKKLFKDQGDWLCKDTYRHGLAIAKLTINEIETPLRQELLEAICLMEQINRFNNKELENLKQKLSV